MSRVELKMPSYGMADTESVVTAWLREPGEQVAEGDPVVSIDTAKTEVTLESPAAGCSVRTCSTWTPRCPPERS